MGAISTKVWAQSGNPPTQTETCAQQGNDSAEVQNAPDTDNVDLLCGDQNGTDGQETVGAADTDNVEEQVGDQSSPDNGVEAPEVEAPAAP
jgi:hypothetical protein